MCGLWTVSITTTWERVRNADLSEMEQHLIQDPAFTAGSCVVPVPSVQGPHRVARSEGALLELVLQVDPCVFAGLLSQGWVMEDALSVLPGSP